MIYLTGDTHIPIDIDKLNVKNFPEQKNLTRNDYVIILGDFGLLWKNDKTYQYWLDILSKKHFTILWIDGNHENHEWINSLPISTWNNGKVHFITDNIIHLMRGQIFNINNHSFLTIGGGASIDKAQRTPHISWWEEENINNEQINETLDNLEKINYKVDYILTHSIFDSLLKPMLHLTPWPEGSNSTEQFLEHINNAVTFKQWFFGHYHMDVKYDKYQCLYNTIIKLEE